MQHGRQLGNVLLVGPLTLVRSLELFTQDVHDGICGRPLTFMNRYPLVFMDTLLWTFTVFIMACINVHSRYVHGRT
jgi:hypothetical protein